MAVVLMHKVRVVSHSSKTDEVLSILQKHSAIAFTETTFDSAEEITLDFPHAQLLPKVQHAVLFLKPYEQKRSLWKTLREGSTTDLSESDVLKKVSDTDAVAQVVEEVEKIQVEFTDANEQVRKLSERRESLKRWDSLTIPLQNLKTEFTRTLLLKDAGMNRSDKTSFKERVLKAVVELTDSAVVTEVSSNQIALTIENKITASKVDTMVSTAGAEIVTLTGVEVASVEVTATEEKLASAKSQVALLHDQGEHAAITHLKRLEIVEELLTWEKDRYSVLQLASATKETNVFDGWLSSSKKTKVEAEFAEKELPVAILELELAEDEEPPVEIENNRFFRPFEVITRLYGMPGHRDLDPTAFLAAFFFLFFGLSLTDVGYGAILMIVSLMILFLFKVSDTIKIFAQLLFFMGFSAVLVGIIFGSYFGSDIEALPEILQKIALFDPIGNPLPVFYMALAFGVLQVMVGMVLKIYSESRNNNFVGGLFDQGPWLLMFFLLLTYLGVATGYFTFIAADQVVKLIYVGIVLIVLASGRHGKTILEKIQKSALSLYDSIGYFSDILSYSRLLALGLATTALAFAVNLIADIVREAVPYLGVVLALLVLLIGHAFTLAVNTLGAFIHSARLQFVEFFGKFIAGTGQEFKPLSRSQKHVVITEDGP